MSSPSPLSPGEKAVLSTILLSIAIMVGIDILSDSREGTDLSHIIVESCIAFVALVGYWLVMRKSQKAMARLKISNEELLKSQQEAIFWKENSKVLIEGLSKAIDEQFSGWKFSNSEKEIALLLLKGLSLKEISEIRNTAEKTTRTQATAIYQKSNLAGRAELSAFFLEDLLSLKGGYEHS